MKLSTILTMFGLMFCLACGDDTDSDDEKGQDKDTSMDSDTTAEAVVCDEPVVPDVEELETIDSLPDPFLFMNGERVTSKDAWSCRRAEMLALIEAYVYGPTPPEPDAVTGEMDGDTLTVTVTEGDKSIDFSVTIIPPSSGGEGPFPAVIAYWASSFPEEEIGDRGVATINFMNDDIAEQQDRSSLGKGKFYDLYGSDHPAGAITAWAWGVSRLIDALESTPEANIDPTHLAVTGCSRNGKGALVAGAFDERIALTIPVESGAGGDSNWRVADVEYAEGAEVQTARQIITENVWMAPAFRDFVYNVRKLPVDQHSVAALVAPRGLLLIENTSMQWLCPICCYTTATAAKAVWTALGVPENMGFSQDGHSDHCVFPAAQEPDLAAFVSRFLLDEEGETDFLKTDGSFEVDEETWIPWETPSLE